MVQKSLLQSLDKVSRAYFTSIDIALSQYFLLIHDQNTTEKYFLGLSYLVDIDSRKIAIKHYRIFFHNLNEQQHKLVRV